VTAANLRNYLRPIIVALPATSLALGLLAHLFGRSDWPGPIWAAATIPVLIALLVKIIVSFATRRYWLGPRGLALDARGARLCRIPRCRRGRKRAESQDKPLLFVAAGKADGELVRLRCDPFGPTVTFSVLLAHAAVTSAKLDLINIKAAIASFDNLKSGESVISTCQSSERARRSRHQASRHK
jgi:hypothetical protein